VSGQAVSASGQAACDDGVEGQRGEHSQEANREVFVERRATSFKELHADTGGHHQPLDDHEDEEHRLDASTSSAKERSSCAAVRRSLHSDVVGASWLSTSEQRRHRRLSGSRAVRREQFSAGRPRRQLLHACAPQTQRHFRFRQHA